jgi:hypothetical protein
MLTAISEDFPTALPANVRKEIEKYTFSASGGMIFMIFF